MQEAETAQAERVVVEGLKRMRWGEADLSARRKSERGKVQLAWELRSKTTMPLAWIQGRGSDRLAVPAGQRLLKR